MVAMQNESINGIEISEQQSTGTAVGKMRKYRSAKIVIIYLRFSSAIQNSSILKAMRLGLRFDFELVVGLTLVMFVVYALLHFCILHLRVVHSLTILGAILSAAADARRPE